MGHLLAGPTTRRVALALLFSCAAWLDRATVANAAVQLLSVGDAALRAASNDSGDAGRVRTRATILDDDGAARAALLANAVVVVVDDRGTFHASASITGCRLRPSGRIICRNSSRNVRVLVEPAPQQPGFLTFVLLLRHLTSTATGTVAPRGPVTLTLHAPVGTDRVDIISDCTPQSQHGLVCHDLDRPNLILIVTDDQRWDSLGYMPRLQSLLVDHGVTFANSFVTTSVCCPSRASGLSGLYAHNHGVLTNLTPEGGAPKFVGPDSSTIATWLHDAGYRTGMYGKYLTGYSEQVPPFALTPYIPPGWDEWHVLVNELYYNYQLTDNAQLVSYGSAAADYSTDVLAAKVVDFINTAHGQPFFVFLAPKAPHSDNGGALPKPAPRHADAFAGIEPWRPPSWDEEDVTDKAAWDQALPRASQAFGFITAGAWADATRRYGLESLLAVDEAVEAIIDALESTGQADKTAIVYTSDNGVCWFEHRLNGKPCEFEECLRVPLVIRYPRMILSPREEDGIALNIDLAPTLAALAGVTPATAVNGQSLVPLLRDQPYPWRDDFLFEHWDFLSMYHNQLAGVRNQSWKYVEYDNPAHEAELFDRQADPYELDGAGPLATRPDVVATMELRLDQLRDQ